jgi:hypothetical protein
VLKLKGIMISYWKMVLRVCKFHGLIPFCGNESYCYRGTSVSSKDMGKKSEGIGNIQKALVNNVAHTTLDCSKAVRDCRSYLN